ncbi:MAG: electron transfer flavoprotein subunit alpha/FixB family protein [Candidatus Bathyarchaeia archaeon]
MSVLVVAEHRGGKIRDVTYELLRKTVELREKTQLKVSTAILGHEVKGLADQLACRGADEVLVVEDKRLGDYHSEGYLKMLSEIVKERKPALTMMGHTSMGIDLAPALASQLNLPLATDCINVKFEDQTFKAYRQMYGGKVEVEVAFPKDSQYVVTFRSGLLEPIGEGAAKKAEIIPLESKLKDEDFRCKFLDYIKPVEEGVDITKSEVLVSVGRGIGKQENIPLVEGLANALGGALAASRPVVDKGWLPKGRQVGVSGKIVKPKLYVAVGISGATQHVTGMKGSNMIVAINKDPNAPIFNYAHYGIVDDLFKVVPQLIQALKKK